MWSMHQDKGAELHIRVVDLQSRVDEAVSALQHHHRSRRGIDAIIAVLSNDRRDAASQTKNENE